MSRLRRTAAAFLVTLIAVGAALTAIQAPAHAASARGGLFGPYTIRPTVNQNYCLDVTGVSYSNGALMQIYQCLGNQQYNQVFYLWAVEGTASYYQITPAHDWKCLDVQGVSYNDWAPIQQYDCLGANQLNQVFNVSWDSNAGAYTISARHSFKFVNYAGTYNGASVYQRGLVQYWTLVPA